VKRDPFPKEHVYFLAGVSLGCTLGLWLGVIGFGIVF